jgi:hypothetical protein
MGAGSTLLPPQTTLYLLLQSQVLNLFELVGRRSEKEEEEEED